MADGYLMENYLGKRAPGKRQVKPTAALFEYTADDDDEDEEEDGDFAPIDQEMSDASTVESDNSDEEEDEESSNDSDKENMCDKDQTSSGTLQETGSDEISQDRICSICMNLTNEEEEICVCNRCQIAVHESCYDQRTRHINLGELANQFGETEPWFCEPCLFLENEVPFCELCPSRYGAFKCSEIPGSYVHLICAEYIPRVTFGDVDHNSAISWQQIDHKLFGKRPCAGCTTPIEARCGITVNCDAGLCKEYHHVTCAQRLGLLVPIAEGEEQNGTLYCKRHSNSTAMKMRAKRCQQWLKQEENRLLRYLRQPLSEVEDLFRQKMKEKLLQDFKELDGIAISLPLSEKEAPRDLRMRFSRSLLSSSKAIDGFRNKFISSGGISADFDKKLTEVKGSEASHLPVAFSREFTEYREHRDTSQIPSISFDLKKLTMRLDAKKIEEEEKFEKLQKLRQDVDAKKAETQKKLNSLQNVFTMLADRGLKMKIPTKYKVALKQGMKNSIQNVPVKASKEAIDQHSCHQCQKNNDQHLLIECDHCHYHYHLGCLDPPLKKRPNKLNCQWICTECVSSDDSLQEKPPANQGRRSRKPTQRYFDEYQDENIPVHKSVAKKNKKKKTNRKTL